MKGKTASNPKKTARRSKMIKKANWCLDIARQYFEMYIGLTPVAFLFHETGSNCAFDVCEMAFSTEDEKNAKIEAFRARIAEISPKAVILINDVFSYEQSTEDDPVIARLMSGEVRIRDLPQRTEAFTLTLAEKMADGGTKFVELRLPYNRRPDGTLAFAPWSIGERVLIGGTMAFEL